MFIHHLTQSNNLETKIALTCLSWNIVIFLFNTDTKVAVLPGYEMRSSTSLVSFAQWRYHSQWSTNWGVVIANWKLNPIPLGRTWNIVHLAISESLKGLSNSTLWNQSHSSSLLLSLSHRKILAGTGLCGLAPWLSVWKCLTAL